MAIEAKMKWSMIGDVISACDCDWGCPCNFNAPPTRGGCEGIYCIRITRGEADGVTLDGLTIGIALDAPRAIHQGNVVFCYLVDEKATPDQRRALEPILAGKHGPPFAIFANVAEKIVGPEYVPVEWKFAGSDSYARMGDTIDVRLATIKNPVSGQPIGYTLNFHPTGLLTKQSELCSTSTYTVSHREMSFSHPGKYGQTFKIEWGQA
jgi:hypothetical protein